MTKGQKVLIERFNPQFIVLISSIHMAQANWTKNLQENYKNNKGRKSPIFAQRSQWCENH